MQTVAVTNFTTENRGRNLSGRIIELQGHPTGPPGELKAIRCQNEKQGATKEKKLFRLPLRKSLQEIIPERQITPDKIGKIPHNFVCFAAQTGKKFVDLF